MQHRQGSSRHLLRTSSTTEAYYRVRRRTAAISIHPEVVAKMLTMTPKLKLNEDARKTLLSCILKFLVLLLGM
jgi:hypothetical protein